MADLFGTLPPELALEQQRLNRQQKMAEMLLAQGAQPQAAGQMVSGRYVPNSFFQNLQGPVNMLLGAYMANKGDKAALDLAKQLRETQTKMGEQYFEAMSPTQTELAGPTPTGTPLTTVNQPDYRKAFTIATDPYAPKWLQAQAAEMLKTQKVGEGEKVYRFNPATGKNEVVAEGGEKYRAPIQVDVGNRYELRDPRDPTKILQVIPKSLSPAESINMTYEGKIAGGMPSVGAPNVSAVSTGGTMPVSNAPTQTGTTTQTAKNQFLPANLPTYQYNPILSPKQNQEAAAEFSKKLQTNIDNAKDSFTYLKDAAEILTSNKPSSGRGENIITGTREFFGGGGEASKADAQLNVLAGGLTMKQPRFEGPQGVLDVQLYQKLAGDVGNPNVPIASRLGAIDQMIALQKKYYPNGDWDSIDTGGAVVKKNVLGGTRGLGAQTLSPTEYRKTLSPIDQEAFDFVRKNPNDKRTPAIKKRLGIE